MSELLLFLLVSCWIASSGGSGDDGCQLELSELRASIQRLDQALLLGEWKLAHMRAHRRLKTVPKTEPWASQNETTEPLLPSTGGSLLVHDRDCSELFERIRPESGFYRIKPKVSLEPFLVYCDMEDGGGWTTLQKRRNGKVDFNRIDYYRLFAHIPLILEWNRQPVHSLVREVNGDWEEYKNGFGHFKTSKDEFWLGNDHIHILLNRGENVMKIDLMDWNGKRTYAMYDNFRVADEKDKYRLYYGMYSGRAGDALSGGSNMVEQWSASHTGMQFSTRDQDNDRYLQGSCAKENKGGWWYNRCHAANLNGRFYRGGEYKAKHDNGVVWSTWKGLWYSLRHTSMKVRPAAFMDSLGSGAGPLA